VVPTVSRKEDRRRDPALHPSQQKEKLGAVAL